MALAKLTGIIREELLFKTLAYYYYLGRLNLLLIKEKSMSSITSDFIKKWNLRLNCTYLITKVPFGCYETVLNQQFTL